MDAGKSPARRLKSFLGKRVGASRRLAEKEKEIETLKAGLTQAQRDERRTVPDGDPPVFFLTGRAKSGTSWLMRILDAHPEVLCKGEGRFFGRGFKREDFMNSPGAKPQPSSLYRAILDADYLRAWVERSNWTRGDDTEEHLRELTRLATRHFLAAQLAKTGKRIVGDKTPILDAGMLEEISTIYPGAKVIHIIRDGRDTAVSTVHHMWNNAREEGGTYYLTPEEKTKRESYRADPEKFLRSGESLFTPKRLRNIATFWEHQIGQVTGDGRTLLGDDYAEVRYEDLLERPVKEVARLLEFLGADATEEAARRCVEAASFERWTKDRERGEEDSTSFLRKGVAGDWRNVFTARDREIFKEHAGDLLIRLGYERDHDW